MCIHSIEKEDDRKAPRAVATGKPNYHKNTEKKNYKKYTYLKNTNKYSQQLSKKSIHSDRAKPASFGPF